MSCSEEEDACLLTEEKSKDRATRKRPLTSKWRFFSPDFGISGAPEDGLPRSVLVRNLVAFWLLGLCNNFAYCIMLSAAHDILDEEGGSGQKNRSSEFDPARDCNPMSTGAILLADILPSLVIKTVAPFFLTYTVLQVGAAIVLALASFVAVACANVTWLTYAGVAFASLSSGLGEVTLLRYSTSYTKNVISTWASGTGMSGVLGSFSYAAITSTGFSPRNTLLTMTVVPVLMAVSYFVILVHPKKMKKLREKLVVNASPLETEVESIAEDAEVEKQPAEANIKSATTTSLSFKDKLWLLVPLLKYMIPLSLVYLAEYFINQGLVELIFFTNTSLTHDEQYRWYQVLYQVGVFISRSSVNFVQIRHLWVLPVLQLINVVIFVCEAYYLFMPSIWIIMVLILYEGLLGGSSYVNTFFRITQEIEEPHREFSMGAASMADSIGITIAGFISIPVHDALCRSSIPT